MTITLEEKIRATENILAPLANEHNSTTVRVAWTGGKDSTVVLFIWKTLLDHHGLGPTKAINLDTGCKFPEILRFRDHLTEQWAIDLHIARPKVNLDGYPLAQNTTTCCRELKIEPLTQAIRDTETTILLTGIRRDEHPDRACRHPEEKRNNPPHRMINPILDWTESDIWAFHARFDLPHCELYDQGYRSLGCQPCTHKAGASEGERSGRDQSKERSLKTLTDLGYF